MGAFPPPPPPRPPNRKALPVLIVVIVAGLVLLGGGIALSRAGSEHTSSKPSSSDAWSVGQCVDTATAADTKSASSRHYNPVACDDKAAQAKITKVMPYVGIMKESGCPDDADGAANVMGVGAFKTVCLRNLNAPHPGDPGQGGGVIRVGDCITYTGFFDGETPCEGGKAYGKVTGRATDQARCPATETLEVFKLEDTPLPVLCVGEGGTILGPGECIEDPSEPFGTDLMTKMPRTAECGASSAWGRITGRTTRQSECPSGTNRYLTQKNAYKPVMCVRTV